MSDMQLLNRVAACAWEAGIFLRLACHPRKRSTAAPIRVEARFRGWVTHVSHEGELREAGKLPDPSHHHQENRAGAAPSSEENDAQGATETKAVHLTRDIDLVNIGLFRGVGVGTSLQKVVRHSQAAGGRRVRSNRNWLRNCACIHRTVSVEMGAGTSLRTASSQSRNGMQGDAGQNGKRRLRVCCSQTACNPARPAGRGVEGGAGAGEAGSLHRNSILTVRNNTRQSRSPRLCSVEEEVVFW